MWSVSKHDVEVLTYLSKKLKIFKLKLHENCILIKIKLCDKVMNTSTLTEALNSFVLVGELQLELISLVSL